MTVWLPGSRCAEFDNLLFVLTFRAIAFPSLRNLHWHLQSNAQDVTFELLTLTQDGQTLLTTGCCVTGGWVGEKKQKLSQSLMAYCCRMLIAQASTVLALATVCIRMLLGEADQGICAQTSYETMAVGLSWTVSVTVESLRNYLHLLHKTSLKKCEAIIYSNHLELKHNQPKKERLTCFAAMEIYSFYLKSARTITFTNLKETRLLWDFMTEAAADDVDEVDDAAGRPLLPPPELPWGLSRKMECSLWNLSYRVMTDSLDAFLDESNIPKQLKFVLSDRIQSRWEVRTHSFL